MDYNRILRKLRSHPATLGEMGPGKVHQVALIMQKCKIRLMLRFERKQALIRYHVESLVALLSE